MKNIIPLYPPDDPDPNHKPENDDHGDENLENTEPEEPESALNNSEAPEPDDTEPDAPDVSPLDLFLSNFDLIGFAEYYAKLNEIEEIYIQIKNNWPDACIFPKDFLVLPKNKIICQLIMFNPEPLKKALKDSGMSVQQIMECMGWQNHASWYRLFAEGNPNWATVERLSTLLRVPLCHLSTEEPNVSATQQLNLNVDFGQVVGNMSGGNVQGGQGNTLNSGQTAAAAEEKAAMQRELEMLREQNKALQTDKVHLQDTIDSLLKMINK